MSSKHKRTKACKISKKTKLIVYERDGGCCIFCGKSGLPEAHVIPRSQGGLGCPENIVTACRKCHEKLDNSTDRKKMQFYAISYLRSFYTEWKKEDFIFEKWRKDKGKRTSESKGYRGKAYFEDFITENSLNDKGEPPDRFRFLQ